MFTPMCDPSPCEGFHIDSLLLDGRGDGNHFRLLEDYGVHLLSFELLTLG